MIFINKFKELLDYYFNILCIVLIIFLLSGVIVLLYRSFNNTEKNIKETKEVAINEAIEENIETIKVDIKGAVKKPGVYEIKNNSNVLDLINKAGGLTKNASTDNINLSRVLEDQMVIKIYTKNQIKKQNSNQVAISECVCTNVEVTECLNTNTSVIKTEGENINIKTSTSETSITENSLNNKISINTATKEELMSLNSIGDSKANAIIEYRNTNGLFKTIEEIKNVSGIGDALFEKIKDNITI